MKFRMLHIWSGRNFEIRVIAKLVLAALAIFFVFKTYFWGMYSLEVHLRGQREFNTAVSKAINRALLLQEQHDKYPIVAFGLSQIPVPYCTLSDILEGGVEVYQKCWVTMPIDLDRCGTFLFDPGCRAIKVPEELWENNIVRKKIIYAGLHSCDFLIGVDDLDMFFGRGFEPRAEENQVQFDYDSYSRFAHQSAWNRAGCAKNKTDAVYQVDTVFIENCQIVIVSGLQQCNLVSVYEAN